MARRFTDFDESSDRFIPVTSMTSSGEVEGRRMTDPGRSINSCCSITKLNPSAKSPDDIKGKLLIFSHFRTISIHFGHLCPRVLLRIRRIGRM